MNEDDVGADRPLVASGAMRASDADRNKIVEMLYAAANEGRLTLVEADDRVQATYQARTHDELGHLVADLPEAHAQPPLAAPPAPGPGVVPAAEPLVLRTTAGDIKHQGQWIVPRQITASCKMGNIKIDFTQAICHQREIDVDAHCGMGNIVLIVPRGWTVRVGDVTTGMGNMSNRATGPTDPDAPTLVVHGRVGMGNIVVKYPSRWTERRLAQ